MTDTTAAPAPAPTAAPSPSPAPAPAAPAPSPATAPESLFNASAPAPAPGTAPDANAWLPEKYRVMNAEGVLDLEASSKKLAEGYDNAAKRIGSGDIRPAAASDYKLNVPEEYKDVQLDEGLTNAFRERAHAAGLTQAQYDMVMGEYFSLVPSVLDAAAKHTATSAREALQQVWAQPGQFDAQMKHAERGFSLVPQQLQMEIQTSGQGTNPVVAQLLAHFGAMTREDSPPSGSAAPSASDPETLMKSEAYRNPKHPDHARVSQQVQQSFAKRHGDAPVY